MSLEHRRVATSDRRGLARRLAGLALVVRLHPLAGGLTMVDELGETHVLVPAPTVSELRAEIARLREQVEQYRADAARYQWLKTRADLTLKTSCLSFVKNGVELVSSHYLASNSTQFPAVTDLDDSIDDAMEAQP